MAAAAWAQAPADPLVELSGKVVDSATQQPVEGAWVILVRMGVAGDRNGSDIYKVEPGTGLSDPRAAGGSGSRRIGKRGGPSPGQVKYARVCRGPRGA